MEIIWKLTEGEAGDILRLMGQGTSTESGFHPIWVKCVRMTQESKTPPSGQPQPDPSP